MYIVYKPVIKITVQRQITNRVTPMEPYLGARDTYGTIFG